MDSFNEEKLCLVGAVSYIYLGKEFIALDSLNCISFSETCSYILKIIQGRFTSHVPRK